MHQYSATSTLVRHPSVPARRAGRVLSGAAVAFLLVDAIGKLLQLGAVVEGTASLGYPVSVIVPLGIIQLTSLVLYLIPRTSVLGAALLTGYLGGAVATHVRIGDPLFTHVLFPAYLGALIWSGLVLRDARLRVVLPWH